MRGGTTTACGHSRRAWRPAHRGAHAVRLGLVAGARARRRRRRSPAGPAARDRRAARPRRRTSRGRRGGSRRRLRPRTYVRNRGAGRQPHCPRSWPDASTMSDVSEAIRARSTPPAGRSRSPSSSASPCTARTASTPGPPSGSGGPGAAVATSSPRPRWARCSAPSSPASSTPSGRPSSARTRSPSSTPAPGRDAGACWRRRRRRAAPRCCATSPSRSPSRSEHCTRAGVES